MDTDMLAFLGIVQWRWPVRWQVGCPVSPPGGFLVPWEGYIIDSGTAMAAGWCGGGQFCGRLGAQFRLRPVFWCQRRGTLSTLAQEWRPGGSRCAIKESPKAYDQHTIFVVLIIRGSWAILVTHPSYSGLNVACNLSAFASACCELCAVSCVVCVVCCGMCFVCCVLCAAC